MPKSTYVIAIISITSPRNVSDVTVSDSDIHQLQFGSWVSYGRWSFEVAYANTTACHCGFYRAMLSLLCIRGTSHGPVSVCLCLSDTSRCSTKTAKHRITQTTPHDTPRNSSFLLPKISAKFDRSHLLRGRRMQVGWVKIGDFRQITGYISKTVKIDT